MKKNKLKHAIMVIIALFSSVAFADYCADIRHNCNQAFQADMAACGNYTDQQAESCYERAHQQLAYCVKSANCGG